MGLELRRLVVIGLIAMCSSIASASEILLRADRNRLIQGETLIVELAIVGAPSGLERPRLELGGNFRAVGEPVRRNEISSREGHSRIEFRYLYTLETVRSGVFDLGPVRARTATGELVSNTLRVEVLPASGAGRAMSLGPGVTPDPPVTPAAARPSAPDPEPVLNGASTLRGRVRLLASLDRGTVYVGQEVTYTLELLAQQLVSGANPQTEPQFTGLWTEPVAVPARPDKVRRRADGQNWEVYLLRRAKLFPASAGTVRIEPAIWTVSVVIPDNLYANRKELLRSSQPLELEVLALPEVGRPPGFRGAVGRYQVTANLDSATAAVGEPIRLVVGIEGEGHFAGLSPPHLVPPPGVRSYEPVAVANAPQGRGWEFTVVATRPGLHRFPPVEFGFFDPVREQYQVASSPMVSFTATGDELPVPTAAPDSSAAEVADMERSSMVELAPIATALTSTSPVGGGAVPHLYERWVVRAWLAVPFLLHLLVVPLVQWRRRRRGSPNRSRLGALRVARHALDAAGRLLRRDRAQVPAAIAAAVHGYLESRFEVGQGELSRERIRTLLEGQAGAEVSDGFVKMLDRLDYHQFTPVVGRADEMRRLLREARGRLRQLDRRLGERSGR